MELAAFIFVFFGIYIPICVLVAKWSWERGNKFWLSLLTCLLLSPFVAPIIFWLGSKLK